MQNSAKENDKERPSVLIKTYEQIINQIIQEKITTIHGIYRNKDKYVNKNKKCYGGFYYDILIDQVTGNKLTLKIPEKLQARVKDGNVYSFKGNMEGKIKKGENILLDVLFVPDQILSEEASQVDFVKRQRIAKLYEKKQSRIGYDVDKTFKQFFHNGESPRISILYGNNGIVDSDVMSALDDAVNKYLLRNTRVSFINRDEIIRAMRKLENYSDIIAIVRGGGSGLEVFDDIDLANAVLNARVPVVAAIGHDQDNTLIKRIADKAFSTPTAFGNYLREMALGVGERREVREEIVGDVQEQSVGGLLWGILFVIGILFLFFWRN